MRKGFTSVFFLFIILIVSIVVIWKYSSVKASGYSYVALGDSVTYGSGVANNDSYPQVLANLLSGPSHIGITLTNLAVPGLTTAILLDKVKNDQAYRQAIANADLVTVDIGLNDYNNPKFQALANTCGGSDNQDCYRTAVTNFNNNYPTLINEIKILKNQSAQSIKIINLYYPSFSIQLEKDAGTFTTQKYYFDQLNQQIQTTASNTGIALVNIHDQFNGVSGEEDGVSKGLVLKYPDGTHPTTQGHTVIANTINNYQTDSDQDIVADIFDNCPTTANTNQINNNSETISLPKPKYSFDDATNAIGDNVGDACDADIDHDGLTNAQEATLGTNANNPDTDNDGVLDGAENKCGSNPNLSSSQILNGAMVGGIRFVTAGTTSNPDTDSDGVSDSCEAIYGSNPNVKDTDGDKLPDGVEILKLGTDPTKTDTDADNCDDAIEVASINGDRAVNSGDQGLLSSMIVVNAKKGDANYVLDFDLNRDGVINSGDQGLQTSQINKSCPTPPPPASQ